MGDHRKDFSKPMLKTSLFGVLFFWGSFGLFYFFLIEKEMQLNTQWQMAAV